MYVKDFLPEAAPDGEEVGISRTCPRLRVRGCGVSVSPGVG